MPLSLYQKAHPFRWTSSGTVIERSLKAGNAAEWHEWWASGAFDKAWKRGEGLRVMAAGAEGFVRGDLEPVWLDRLLASVWPDNALLPSMGWARPLLHRPDALDAVIHAGGSVFAPLGGGSLDAPNLWTCVLQDLPRQKPPEQAAALARLEAWLTDPLATPDSLGAGLAETWALLGRMAASQPALAHGLDRLAQTLVARGASPSGQSARLAKTAVHARATTVQALGTVEWPSLAPSTMAALLANHPPGAAYRPSGWERDAVFRQWEPGQNAWVGAWLALADPWSTRRVPSINGGALVLQGAASSWWDSTATPEGAAAAAPWLEALALHAKTHPPPSAWFESLGPGLTAARNHLTPEATEADARAHGQALGRLLIDLSALHRSAPGGSGALVANCRYTLDVLSAHPRHPAFLEALFDAWGPSVGPVLDVLLSGRPGALEKITWEPAAWWGRALATPALQDRLARLPASPDVVATTWTTLVEPRANHAHHPALQPAVCAILEQWGRPPDAALALAWVHGVAKAPEQAMALLDLGLGTRPKDRRDWGVFEKPSLDSFGAITPDAAQRLIQWVDHLSARGWAVSDGPEGNVLRVLQAARAFPDFLLPALEERGARAASLTVRNTSGQAPLDALIRRHAAEDRAAHLETALDAPSLPTPARKPRL